MNWFYKRQQKEAVLAGDVRVRLWHGTRVSSSARGLGFFFNTHGLGWVRWAGTFEESWLNWPGAWKRF
jgi:hypothetical protein